MCEAMLATMSDQGSPLLLVCCCRVRWCVACSASWMCGTAPCPAMGWTSLVKQYLGHLQLLLLPLLTVWTQVQLPCRAWQHKLYGL